MHVAGVLWLECGDFDAWVEAQDNNSIGGAAARWRPVGLSIDVARQFSLVLIWVRFVLTSMVIGAVS